MPTIRYKYCIVPECRNTTQSAPNKLFFSVPTGEIRKKWCEVMGRDPDKFKPLSLKSNRFCCEDHFDLQEDMRTYWQWKIQGKGRTLLKKGVLPHKFDCQVQQNDRAPSPVTYERETFTFYIMNEEEDEDVEEFSNDSNASIKNTNTPIRLEVKETVDTHLPLTDQEPMKSEVSETYDVEFNYESDSSGDFEILKEE